ncbi:hypothetical protein DCO57_16825 [Labrenzia sp. 011]|nr:hypothetical protein DCO57_16825 [Labrenzia sp. 011]
MGPDRADHGIGLTSRTENHGTDLHEWLASAGREKRGTVRHVKVAGRVRYPERYRGQNGTSSHRSNGRIRNLAYTRCWNNTRCNHCIQEPQSFKSRNIQIRTFRTLFLSDIHLGTRGCQAEPLRDFLRHHQTETRGHRAILLTSMIFASLHLTFGVDTVAITFFASIVFGYVYLYQKNLAGVVLMHYWFGVLAALMVAIWRAIVRQARCASAPIQSSCATARDCRARGLSSR